MKTKTKLQWIFDILLLAMGVFYLVGINAFFSACGPKEDGSFMTCHWAGEAVRVFVVVLIILAILHFCAGSMQRRQGVSLSIAVAALAAIAIPGHAISLCMMPDMQCRAAMQPGVTVCSVVMALLALLDVVVSREKKEV